MLKGNTRGASFSDEDIINESKTMIVAGHETSATSLAVTLLMLAQHHDCQQKLYEEVMAIAPSGDVSTEQCADMVYLECVIKESLRLFPILPLMTREVAHPITLSGREIPSGTQVMVSALSMQRSKKCWGDTANEFNPDRFLPENLPENSASLYVPFASGNRTCIGMRYAYYALKVNLVKILRNFILDTPLKLEEIVCTVSGILQFRNIENVQFARRVELLVQYSDEAKVELKGKSGF